VEKKLRNGLQGTVISRPIALMNELGAGLKEILTSICIIPGFLPYTQ